MMTNVTDFMIPAKIYTVSELNAGVRAALEDVFSFLWLSGEISNLHVHGSSGHIYFSLKDERAQVRCAMFRSHSQRVSFQLQNGMQVVVQAHVSVYEARGEYQLIVQHMEQAGVGLLQQQFLALKEKLHREGLFDVAHKKALPKVPRCVGVITSPTGAAIHDILSVLRRRFPLVDVIIYPTQVQGSEAAAQIVCALERANKRCECEVLIVGRGGGSLEDLWPFNEEVVARAIFASNIPIISAVGHEVDFTIADFVADWRAPTPSAAAEIVVPDIVEKVKLLVEGRKRLIYLMQHKLQYADSLLLATKARLKHPHQILQQQMQKLDDLERYLLSSWQHRVQMWHHQLTNISNSLNTLSPLATLRRGYAVVRSQRCDGVRHGAVIFNAAEVKNGDIVSVLLAEGELECSVLSTK